MIEKNEVYRHFKGMRYLVIDVAKFSETGESLVIYRELYGDENLWARPLSMFLEKIEEGRDDNVTGQTYRFEKVVNEK